MTFLLGYGTILLNMTLAPTASFNSAAVVLQFSFSSSDAALLVHFAVSAVSSNSSIQGIFTASEPTLESMSMLNWSHAFLVTNRHTEDKP